MAALPAVTHQLLRWRAVQNTPLGTRIFVPESFIQRWLQAKQFFYSSASPLSLYKEWQMAGTIPTGKMFSL